MQDVYEIIADLLEYPTGESWAGRLDAARRLPKSGTAVAARLSEFIERAARLTLDELQEQYTRTFDLNPVCTLEVGYHLFGENYKRGVFLANLRETEAPFALGQEHQLPDYLPVLLRLLGKLEDQELRRDLIIECLIPALGVMVESLSKAESLYAGLLAAVGEELKSEAPETSEMVAASVWRRRVELPVLQGGGF